MKTRICVCICLTVLLLACGTGPIFGKLEMTETLVKCKTRAYGDAGIKLANEGEYDKAIETFKNGLLLETEEHFIGIHRKNIGTCYVKKSDYITAIRYYIRSGYTGLAISLYEDIGDLDKAIAVARSQPGDGYSGSSELLIGKLYYRKGDLALAIKSYTAGIDNIDRFYRQFIKKEPVSEFNKADYRDLYSNRGLCFEDKSQYAKAVEDYTKALGFEKNPEYYFRRGYCCQKNAEFDKAIADLTEGIKRAPKSCEAYVNRGQCYGEKGDSRKELADYAKAIELEAKYALAYSNRAASYEKTGDTDKALADYGKVIELDPKNATAYYSRGLLYAKKGDNDKAISDYSRVVELCPYEWKTFDERAKCYEAKGETEKAAADKAMSASLTNCDELCKVAQSSAEKGDADTAGKLYTWVIAIKPDHGDAYFGRAGCWEKKKAYVKAIEDYTKAIELKSNLDKAYYARAVCCLQAGHYDEGIADYTKEIEINPRHAEAYLGRGQCYEHLEGMWGNPDTFDEAIADCTKAIDLRADYADAYLTRAECHAAASSHHTSDRDKALADYTKGIELKPDDAEAHFKRAELYRSSAADMEKAIADYSKSIELKPKTDAYVQRAKAYNDVKAYDKALEDYGKAIELSPNDYNVYEQRAGVYASLGETEKAKADLEKAKLM